MLCGAALTKLSMTGGVEQNPGPEMDGESIIQVLCSGPHRILKSGKRCETCGRWYLNSCGNVAESGKKNSYRCRSERIQLLEEELQNILLQIDEL